MAIQAIKSVIAPGTPIGASLDRGIHPRIRLDPAILGDLTVATPEMIFRDVTPDHRIAIHVAEANTPLKGTHTLQMPSAADHLKDENFPKKEIFQGNNPDFSLLIAGIHPKETILPIFQSIIEIQLVPPDNFQSHLIDVIFLRKPQGHPEIALANLGVVRAVRKNRTALAAIFPPTIVTAPPISENQISRRGISYCRDNAKIAV